MLIKSYSSILWCLVTALLQVALSWPPCNSSLMSFHSASIHGFQVWDTATCHHSSLSAVICTFLLTFSCLVIVSVPFCSEPSVHHLCMVITQKRACTLKTKGAYHSLHSSSINPINPSRCAWEVTNYSSSKPCEEQYYAEDTHLSLLICMLVLAQNGGAASCWYIFW